MTDKSDPGEIATRKQEHIDLVLHEEVEFERSTGLERVQLLHEALPELSLVDICAATTLFGRTLSAPILVSGMTGGTDRSRAINRRIAAAVQKLGLGMGVGSQRISIERPDVLGTFQVRDVAPDVLLIANLGGVQLNYGLAVDDCKRLVESIGADAIALHLNPLQEAIQPGGNTDFRGLIEKIEKVCHGLARPVIAKEIGCGISGSTARRLVDAGVAAIDVGGAGGTCWTEIERRRNPSATVKAVAATFREWGTATADAIVQVRAACPAIPLIASGGLRNGLDVAKCLALGADFTAIAGPVLKAAAVSTETVLELLSTYIQELKLAMFCTGSESARDLRRAIQGNPS